MENTRFKILSTKGLTLIEVLLSIILISIILFSFFTFFIQSAKTGKTSEEVVDATYLAQVEMERVYEHSRKGDFNYGIVELIKVSELDPDSNYKQLTFSNPYVFKKKIDDSYIELKLTQHSDSSMSNIVISVFEQDFELVNNQRPRAKMETILEWGS